MISKQEIDNIVKKYGYGAELKVIVNKDGFLYLSYSEIPKILTILAKLIDTYD